MSKIYEYAMERYAEIGVDTEKAISQLGNIDISIHCWQGDDVKGFENTDNALTGGIQATGNYPGRANNPAELREDLDKVLSLVPGNHKVSLHATYAETNGENIARNNLQPRHFENWVEWAKSRNIGLDFNPTLFSHPLSEKGTLTSLDRGIRDFWIEHCIASREIADYMGQTLGKTAVTNLWIPDGSKDTPVDRYLPRRYLKESLDNIFAKETKYNLDAVESKVFGIGAESCTYGSHEFYMGYAVKNNKLITLDTGHFHPTELVSDKITAVADFVPGILLHVSRPVRWDSDHVVVLDDELMKIASEITRNNLFNKVHIGLDFFDASINRIAAWVIGIRNTRKSFLISLLEPLETLKALEYSGDYSARLAYFEEFKSMPWEIVWDEFCERNNVPIGLSWFDKVKIYEKEVLSKRY